MTLILEKLYAEAADNVKENRTNFMIVNMFIVDRFYTCKLVIIDVLYLPVF